MFSILLSEAKENGNAVTSVSNSSEVLKQISLFAQVLGKCKVPIATGYLETLCCIELPVPGCMSLIRTRHVRLEEGAYHYNRSRIEFMVDHRRYTHNLSSCEIKA